MVAENKYGIDRLELMVSFIGVIEADTGSAKSELRTLESYLEQQLKRKLMPQEKINIYEGIIKYLQSDPETIDRRTAMNYLFELKFLTQCQDSK